MAHLSSAARVLSFTQRRAPAHLRTNVPANALKKRSVARPRHAAAARGRTRLHLRTSCALASVRSYDRAGLSTDPIGNPAAAALHAEDRTAGSESANSSRGTHRASHKSGNSHFSCAGRGSMRTLAIGQRTARGTQARSVRTRRPQTYLAPQTYELHGSRRDGPQWPHGSKSYARAIESGTAFRNRVDRLDQAGMSCRKPTSPSQSKRAVTICWVWPDERSADPSQRPTTSSSRSFSTSNVSSHSGSFTIW